MKNTELQRLLRQHEGPKLEFKRQLYALEHSDAKIQEENWHEFIKDVLSLANGNVGFARQTGYLIIGAGDKLHGNGSRDLYHVDTLNIDFHRIHQKMNSFCEPVLPNIGVDVVSLEGKNLLLLSVPPSPYVHETTKPLKTKKQIFSERTVFIRRGEIIDIAKSEEREILRKEKQKIWMSNLYLRMESVEKHLESLLAEFAEDRASAEYGQRIDLARLELAYLRSREKIETNHNLLGRQKGRKLYYHAEDLIQNKIPKVVDRLVEAGGYYDSFLTELRDNATRSLEIALENNFIHSKVYFYLAEQYDIKGDPRTAHEYCCNCIELSEEYVEAYQLGMKICQALKLDDVDRQEAEQCILEYKQKLAQLRIDVDEWGNKI